MLNKSWIGEVFDIINGIWREFCMHWPWVLFTNDPNLNCCCNNYYILGIYSVSLGMGMYGISVISQFDFQFEMISSWVDCESPLYSSDNNYSLVWLQSKAN